MFWTEDSLPGVDVGADGYAIVEEGAPVVDQGGGGGYRGNGGRR
jgi:hypothetical protein